MIKNAFTVLTIHIVLAFIVPGAQCENPSYPISSDVYTTRQQMIMPDTPTPFETVLPYEIPKYEPNGYGKWHYGLGIDAGKQTSIMATDYHGDTVTHTANLLNFFTISDIHITDKETPAQVITLGYKGGTFAAYSGVMLYTMQVLDAIVQTINAVHKQVPFDFGISLGDAGNSIQYNELRWYLDVLDGGIINPDSGDDDDPVPGPNNDYQDEFVAEGLDDSIEWYQVLGNHDHFFDGFLPPNDYIRDTVKGKEILNLGNVITDPLGADSRGIYMGSIDGRTLNGDVIGAGPVEDFTATPTIPAADANRRLLSRSEWINEFFTTTSNPSGHGFTAAMVADGSACYSFVPKPNIPIKIIVLDDTQNDDDANHPDSIGYAHGSLNQERFNWLINELDKGQNANQLMIIAAHIPIGVAVFPSGIRWDPYAPITEAQLIAKLHEYPNLILWLAGHRHLNTVTPFPSTDPQYGFWQIETPSIRDYPQQFRTFKIVRNSDNTISIITTDVDPAITDGSLAAISRSYGIAALEIFNNFVLQPQPSGMYNAELVKQLSPQMQTVIQNYGIPIGTSGQSQWSFYE